MKLKLRLPAISWRMPQKLYLKYALFGIFLYLFFLITTMPAQWLAWGLNKYSHGSAVITQAGGTIWKGRGLLSISYNRGKPVNLGHVKWDIRVFWLLIGQLNTVLDLSGKGIQVHTHVITSPGGITLKKIRASIQAESLGSFYSPASLISPMGLIRINSKELSISDSGILGSAEGKWLDAGSALSNVKPLGSYNLVLTGNGENASFVLTTGNNSALKLVGKGNWALINGLVNFNGTATPVNKKPELESLLILLGRDIGAGKRMLRFSTRIPFAYEGRK